MLRLHVQPRYGATVEELAEECQVHRRTIFRDLQAIADAGYPLIREPEEDGRVLYRFMTGFKSMPPITFSLDELMTLYLCRGQLDFLRGTPFHEDLDAIFGKIRSSLRPSSVAHLERIAEASVPRFQGMRDYSGKKEMLTDLRKALLYQYRCEILYTPPHRDPEKYDLSRLIDYSPSDFRVNTHYTNVVGMRRYKQNGKGYFFSPKLIEWLGPKREGDEIDDPYIDYAASIQKILEDVSLGLIDHYVGDIIRETGRVCFAGGVALNVKLNQKIS